MEEILPTQCYICESRINSECRSVLQLCPCRVVICQRCALYQMVEDENFAFQCLICGNKVDSNSGVIRNVEKMKEAEDRYLRRAFNFFGIQMPPKSTRARTKYSPLLQRFAACGLQIVTNNYHVKKEEKKTSLPFLKLQLARMEDLRGGPLQDPDLTLPKESSFPDEINDQDDEVTLPLGPILYLQLSRNIFLERMLSPEDEIDIHCVACRSPVKQNQSVLFSCDCVMLLCRTCALQDIISSPNTYRKGVRCPTCRSSSVISFENLEAVKQEESSLIERAIEEFSVEEGRNFSSRSPNDMKLLCENIWSKGRAPKGFSTDFTGFNLTQTKLLLARLYCYIEQQRSSQEIRIEEGFDLPLGPLNHLQWKPNVFLELYIAHSQFEDEIDALTDFDWSQFKFNPDIAVQMLRFSKKEEKLNVIPLSSLPVEDNSRFDRFRPQFNTRCPKCGCNPQNSDYVRKHLLNYHNLNLEAVEEEMKNITYIEASYDQRQPRDINSIPHRTPPPPRLSATFEDVSDEMASIVKQLQDETNDEELTAVEKVMRSLQEIDDIEQPIEVSQDGTTQESNSKIDFAVQVQVAVHSTDEMFRTFKSITLFEDVYEVIFHPRLHIREGVTFSDPGQFGSFLLKIKVILGDRDKDGLPYQPENALVDNSGDRVIEGSVNIYTNKIILSAFKNFLSVQLNFRGNVTQFRNQTGRILQGTRSLSYYHIPEHSLVIVRPVGRKDGNRGPRIFQRRNIHRKTHLELAMEHAARKKRETNRNCFQNYRTRNDFDIYENEIEEGEERCFTSGSSKGKAINRADSVLFHLQEALDEDSDHEEEQKSEITWYFDRDKDAKPMVIPPVKLENRPQVSFPRPDPPPTNSLGSYEQALFHDDGDDESGDEAPRKKTNMQAERQRPRYAAHAEWRPRPAQATRNDHQHSAGQWYNQRNASSYERGRSRDRDGQLARTAAGSHRDNRDRSRERSSQHRYPHPPNRYP